MMRVHVARRRTWPALSAAALNPNVRIEDIAMTAAETEQTKTPVSEAALVDNTEPRRHEEKATMTPRVDRRADPAGETPPEAISSDLLETCNRLTDVGRANFDTLTQASHTMLQGGMKCQELWLAFAEQRMQRRYRLFEEARSLTEPIGAIRLQADFGRGLIEDTFRMIEDLAGVGERLASENLARLRESTTATIGTLDPNLDEVA